MSGHWGCLLLLICIVVPHINSGKWITCHNLIILLLVRGNYGLHYYGYSRVDMWEALTINIEGHKVERKG